ncbi:FAD binding domain protein [Hypoxylon sp. FL1857]|nr:FAD binding domain protein [Hypoxylon sp. FL1857]
MMASETPFRVIIVGAGVAGLTASHCLHKAGIDHIILERRADVAPAMGSSIAMYPGSGRIFHQLGILERMETTCSPCKYSWTRGPDGKDIVHNEFFEIVKQNHGQRILLLERRQLLRNLYETLPDMKRVKLNSEVKSINQLPDGVEVVLTDGTVEKGDMVLGADGVRGTVRSMMWEHANKMEPGIITAQEKTCMKTNYKLLLGMGPGAPELGEADMTVCHNTKQSMMTLTQPDHTYFSVYFKLDKPYAWPTRKRYTAEEAEAAAESVADHAVSDQAVFGELWRKRDRAALIGVEEGVLDHWYYDRIALVGDCVHKMTPNIGLGGNMAIESVVVLCNHLQAMLAAKQGVKPSLADLRNVFAAYQAERKPRVVQIMNFSREVTDSHAWATLSHKYYTKWVLPTKSDQFFPNIIAEIVRRAPKLEYVDVKGFNKGKVNWKDEESKPSSLVWSLQWMLRATVLVMLSVGAAQYGKVLPLIKSK